jgi:hypothetical protein
MSLSTDAIVGIISIILGFLFGEISARLREAQTIRRQIQTTKAMLRYETSHNLQRLRLSWQQINPKGLHVEDPSQARYFAEQLATRPLVPFARDVFLSQLSQFSTALSAKEVTTTLTFYDDFAELDTIHRTLAHLLDEERGFASGAPLPGAQSTPHLPPAMPFREQAPAMWHTYQDTVLRCLGQSSPIA